MHKTAILIKTSPARPSLLWCLASVETYFRGRPHRIYISDEEPLDQWKFGLYKRLQEEGHFVEVWPGNVNVGIARNKLLLRMVEEDQVLRLDDDFELGGEFSLGALEEVLWTSDTIGFVADLERQIGDGKNVRSGTLRPSGGEIVVRNGRVIKQFHSPFMGWRTIDYCKYRLASFTRNLLLVKRRVFDLAKWDEDLIFDGEHVDFMLTVKKAGYSGAYTGSSIHLHRDDLAVYREALSSHSDGGIGAERKTEVLKEKWGAGGEQSKYGFTWYFYEAVRRVSFR